MNRPAELTGACLKEEAVTRRVVTVILVLIAGLSFTFSFGNIWALGRSLAVPAWIGPLVGPAADPSLALNVQPVRRPGALPGSKGVGRAPGEEEPL